MESGRIPPGLDAVFDVKITNDSLYHEKQNYALVLNFDELSDNEFGGNMQDLLFRINATKCDRLDRFLCYMMFLLLIRIPQTI